jgi:hypothetical protein
MWAVLFLATAVQAAPPLEPVQARIVAVDVAGREIVADGVTWALESTVAIRMPGKKSAALRDLTPGMNVRLEFAPSDSPEPVVRTVTVLPD